MDFSEKGVAGKPDFLLMLHDGLPDDLETGFQKLADRTGLKFGVIRHPGGPYAGLELYLPTAIGLFLSAGFFNGFLQEAGKDAYIAFKTAAGALWTRSSRLRVKAVGSAGKLAASQLYSLTYSITGEVVPGLSFKLLIRMDTSERDAQVGIISFLDLVDDLLNDRLSETDVRALLTYKPVGGTVLVTYDAEAQRIIPVNAFEHRGSV